MRARGLDRAEIARHHQDLLALGAARASTCPAGSTTKLWPQNSMPSPPGCGSWPTRFGTATKTPLAIAWLRCIVSHAACCASPYCAFSDGCQPIAVG